MIKNLKDYFLAPYDGSDLSIFFRAKTLFYFDLFLVIVLPILTLIQLLVNKIAILSMLNGVLLAIFMSNVIGLMMLRAGRYYFAANITLFVAVSGLGIFSIFGTMKSDIGIVFVNYQQIIMIFFSTFFCKKRMTIFISAFAILLVILSATINHQLSAENTRIFLTNIIFEIAVISAISFLLIRTMEQTMAKMAEDADNMEQFEKTKQLLNSIKEIADKLSLASNEMTSISQLFSDNAQNQAASAEQVTATIEEISSGIENVAQSAIDQNVSIEQLLTKMKELSGVIRDLSGQTKEALTLTDKIANQAKAGDESLGKMTSSMRNIKDTSNEMIRIINMIKDISEKTDLLALNASIEAARAGEAGRGFAVVADEISKLSDQTANSVKEIGALIKSSETEVGHGLDNMQKAVYIISQIITGVNKINQMTNSISGYMQQQNRIYQVVASESEKAKVKSEEIKFAAEEQKIATSEVVKSIANINELTQANASGAEEMSASSHDVADLATNLKENVDNFQMD